MVESRCKTHLQLYVFPKIYFLLPSEISVSVVEEIWHFYLKIKEIWTSDAVEISDGNKSFIFKKMFDSDTFCTLNEIKNSKTQNLKRF